VARGSDRGDALAAKNLFDGHAGSAGDGRDGGARSLRRAGGRARLCPVAAAAARRSDSSARPVMKTVRAMAKARIASASVAVIVCPPVGPIGG
jgi:hypothetical protein